LTAHSFPSKPKENLCFLLLKKSKQWRQTTTKQKGQGDAFKMKSTGAPTLPVRDMEKLFLLLFCVYYQQ
jgi:hypothetical protein